MVYVCPENRDPTDFGIVPPLRAFSGPVVRPAQLAVA